MNLDAMIKNCGFTKEEITTATYGECYFFGIALHNVLREQHVSSNLVIAASGPDRMAWGHVMLKYSRWYYDIRGRIDLKKHAFDQYRTNHVRIISKEEYILDYEKWEGTDSINNKINKWYKRLTT